MSAQRFRKKPVEIEAMLAMSTDLTHATGAHPDYNPQMAESIEVYSNEYIIDAVGWPERLARLAYTILWTDTGGVHHGRLWNHSRAYVESEALTPFPVAVASTQAGCVWVYRHGKDTWAEIQQSHGDHDRYPRIPIQSIYGHDIRTGMVWTLVLTMTEWGGCRIFDGIGR
jgi:hypothetical protein